MSACTWNILADEGATFSRIATWYSAPNTPVNLTGYTAKMEIRTSTDAPTVTLELSTANGRISLGGAAGTITLTAQAADMNFSGRYVYDLELTSGGGAVTRLAMGMIQVRPEVTK